MLGRVRFGRGAERHTSDPFGLLSYDGAGSIRKWAAQGIGEPVVRVG
jgi:hypothetical protein